MGWGKLPTLTHQLAMPIPFSPCCHGTTADLRRYEAMSQHRHLLKIDHVRQKIMYLEDGKRLWSDLNVLPQVQKSQSPGLTGLEVLTLRAFSDCMCLWGPCQAERKEPVILFQYLLNPSISLILLDGSITVTLTGHIRNWDEMCAVAAMFDRASEAKVAMPIETNIKQVVMPRSSWSRNLWDIPPWNEISS